MTYIAQVWAVPALNLPAPLTLASAVSLRAVVAEPPGMPQFSALLLEAQSDQQTLDDSPQPVFRRIGSVLSRLSFSLLTPFHIFSARILPEGLGQGDTVNEVLFPGSPPGIALFEAKLGYNKSVRLDPAFLAGAIPAHVDAAITWFLWGAAAPTSVQQVMCQWTGLECLAPILSGSWECPECRAWMEHCPHCSRPTQGPRAVQSIRRFLEDSLGLTREEFKLLYHLRCRITHGGLAVDPDGIAAASQKAFRIQELLLLAIKRALGWPDGEPPHIEARGMTILGVPGLSCHSVIPSSNFYDQPGIYPA